MDSMTKNTSEEINEKKNQILKSKLQKKNLKNKNQNESDSSSTTSSSEDEVGELITEEFEKDFVNVLNYIKKQPEKLLSSDISFFKKIENEKESVKKTKPLYLQEYQRKKLLEENKTQTNLDYHKKDEYENVKTYSKEEKDAKEDLLSEIKNLSSDDNDSEFFIKKNKTENGVDSNDELNLPDHEQNAEEFLDTFFSKKAWIPRKKSKTINLDVIDFENETNFNDAVEKFEHSYNFRFENPDSENIVSYARNEATIRRSETSRQLKRKKKKNKKDQEKREKEDLLRKKKQEKVNKITDKICSIKDAVKKEIDEKLLKKIFDAGLIEEDFNNDDWNEKILKLFDEHYANTRDSKKEIDHLSNNEFFDTNNISNLSNKKDKKKKKNDEKYQKKIIQDEARKFVNLKTFDILEEVETERGRKNNTMKFKYRDASPESYGLTTREILTCTDAQLNNFIGIKKLSSYKDPKSKKKEKKKVMLKNYLKNWRKAVAKENKNKDISELNINYSDTENDTNVQR